jgi:hypothetical protein
MKARWVAAFSLAVGGLLVALVIQLKDHPAWAGPMETGAATAAAIFTALAAFGSYRSAVLSGAAANDARSALALHNRPSWSASPVEQADGSLRLVTHLGNGGKNLKVSWTDSKGNPGSSSLPDHGGVVDIPTVRVVRPADMSVGRIYPEVDAQRIEYRFQDSATGSSWVATLTPSAGGNLTVAEPLPVLVR